MKMGNRLRNPNAWRNDSAVGKSSVKGKSPSPALLLYLLGLIFFPLMIGGCATVGPDFKTPEAEVAEEWQEEQDSKIRSDNRDDRDWWKAFNDPVLDNLVESAYQQNLPLQKAGIRIFEARAQLAIAIGSQYPQKQQFTGQASVNQISQSGTNFDFLSRNFDLYSIGFDAAWELDFFGKFRRGVESAGANLIATVANYDDLLVTLTAEVARAYVLIRTIEERLAVSRENVAIKQRSLQLTEVRFKYGDVTELDVQQARVLLTDTQAKIPRLEAQLRQAKNGLSILLGIPPGDFRGLLDGEERIPSPPSEVAIGIPADLLRRRPDIRRAEIQAAAQSARIGVAKADIYPSFALFGSIGLGVLTNGSGATAGDLFSNDSLNYSAGGGFRWPFFNYGRIRNNVRVQDARFQELIVEYQNTVLEAAREVEDSLVGFLRAQEEEKYLEDSVVALKRAVEISLIQYREGEVDYQRVIDNQRFLTSQQDQLASTSGNVNLNLIAMYKALGGGSQIREGNEFVSEEIIQVMQERTNWGNLIKRTQLPERMEQPPTGQEVKLFNKPSW